MQYYQPDFFILGGPKCGTTALAIYLDQHPDVLFSYPKEPNFFNKYFSNKYRKAPESFQKYLQNYFLTDKKDPKAVGEGTVWYLYSEVAVKNIITRLPDSRFIVMLRNPVDMAYALHSTEVFARHEDEEDFEKAWQLQEGRKNGKHIPKGCPEVKTILYGEACMLGKQMQRLYSMVPASSVHVIFFEDFIGDTSDAYRQVCQFLSLPEYEDVNFDKINANRTVRNKYLMDVLHYIGRNINLTPLKKKLGIAKRGGIIRWLKNKNSTRMERPPLRPEFRSKLKEYFREDIQLLEKITQKDLLHWIE